MNRKILILRIFLSKMTILRKSLRIRLNSKNKNLCEYAPWAGIHKYSYLRIFVDPAPGSGLTKILRIFLRITLKSKKNSMLRIFLFL